MKALIIADDDNLIDFACPLLKKAGCEIIIYRWLLKALDNIEEIAPDIIVLDASSYPRHWKVVVQYAASDEDRRRFFLFCEKPLSSTELQKATYLGIEKIVCLDSENASSEFESCFSKEKVHTTAPLSKKATKSEQIECIFSIDSGIITGHSSKFDGQQFVFTPDYKAKIPPKLERTIIRNVIIKKIADDKIIAIKARVKAVCANTLELEIEGFSDEK